MSSPQFDSLPIDDSLVRAAILRIYYAGALTEPLAEYIGRIDSASFAKLTPKLPLSQFDGIYSRVLERFNVKLTPKLLRYCYVAKLRRDWDWRDMAMRLRERRYSVNTHKKWAEIIHTVVSEDLLRKKCVPLIDDDWLTLDDDILAAAIVVFLTTPWRPMLDGQVIEDVLPIHKTLLLQRLGVDWSYSGVIDRWLKNAGLERFNDGQAYTVVGRYEWLRPDGLVQVVKQRDRKPGELYFPVVINLWKLAARSPLNRYYGLGSEARVEMVASAGVVESDHDVVRSLQLEHDLLTIDDLPVVDVMRAMGHAPDFVAA